MVSAEQQIDDEDYDSNNTENIKKKSTKRNDGTYLYMSPEQVQ